MLRILFRTLLIVVVTLVVALIAVLAHGAWLNSRKLDRRVPEFAVASGDSALIARGRHLAAIACASCHSQQEELPLTGSAADFLSVPNSPRFGSLRSPNLTTAGNLRDYSNDGLLLRAIREGIDDAGRPMLLMPSGDFQRLSDRDAAAIIAYLRSEAPEGQPTPGRTLEPLGLLVLGLRLFPLSDQPEITGVVEAPPEGSSVEYGRYLSHLLGCRACHGPSLRGGVKGQFPPIGPDLVALVAAHPPETFGRATRGGISSQELPLDPRLMPWRTYSQLDDIEVLALYKYLGAGAD